MRLKTKLIIVGIGALGLAGAWYSATPLQRRLAVVGVLAVIGLVASQWIKTEDETSGREGYETSWISSKIASISSSRSDEADVVPVDRIKKRDYDAPRVPRIDTDTSVIALGQTGRGKSSFVKSVVSDWDHTGMGMIAHALSEGSGNEFEQFFAERMHPDDTIYRLSSQYSTHRWNPFDDFNRSMQSMKAISDGIWTSRNSVETGWSDSARAMLTAALAVTSARHGDFAYLPKVLEDDPVDIVEDCAQLPQGTIVTSSLSSMSESDLGTAYSNLMSEIQPLLLSEIFDEDLPTISLTEYFDEPLGYIILDNIREDTYARPFWRFLIQTAISKSMSHDHRQYFVIDEFDKLPPISNLDELVSAGRSAHSTAVLAAQDVHQLEATYPDLGRSIYSNCPNRAIFACGDEDTAELALSALGRDEVTQTTVSHSTDRDINKSQGINRQRTEKYPLTHNELMTLNVGEALLHSQQGWWLAKITEPDL